MPFDQFMMSNYVPVCTRLNGFLLDEQMKEMIRTGEQDSMLVKSWMRGYGLFQGIRSEQREQIAATFLDFAGRTNGKGEIGDSTITEAYAELFTALHSQVPRSWISATSKLLWCMHPDSVVIYDAYVKRALVVMQCLDSELAQFPRVGDPPKIKNSSDISEATRFYMNYQSMVRHLLERSAGTLKQLREQHQESYPHDIRIIDLLLWWIGNPKQEFRLGAVECRSAVL